MHITFNSTVVKPTLNNKKLVTISAYIKITFTSNNIPAMKIEKNIEVNMIGWNNSFIYTNMTITKAAFFSLYRQYIISVMAHK